MVENKIRNVSDLVKLVTSGNKSDMARMLDEDFDSWFPALVASLNWNVRVSPHVVLLYNNDVRNTKMIDLDDFLISCETYRSQILNFCKITPKTKLERETLKSCITIFLLHTKSEVTFGSLTDPHRLLYLLDTA